MNGVATRCIILTSQLQVTLALDATIRVTVEKAAVEDFSRTFLAGVISILLILSLSTNRFPGTPAHNPHLRLQARLLAKSSHFSNYPRARKRRTPAVLHPPLLQLSNCT